MTAAMIAAALGLAAPGVQPIARANETDQFLLPTDRPMADVGRCVSMAHYLVLERVIERVNKKIRDALAIADPDRRAARLAKLHHPRGIADQIRSEFGPGFFETLGMESELRSTRATAVFPAEAHTIFKRRDWVYSFGTLPIDPRIIPMLVPSSTIKVYGHYLGTDKLGHFHDLGHYYFCDYTAKRAAGKSEADAVREVVAKYSRGVIAETTTIGFLATGVCSNADLASNYAGLKFYRNLTEEVMVDGAVRPPLLVVVGGFWRLNTHVRPESDFFEPFVSDHWNEALNPCVYELGLGWTVARRLRKEADAVVGFYCDVDGRPRDAAYFRRLAEELATYHGEGYGHYGDPSEVMGIATECFGAEEDAEAPPGAPESDGAP